MATTRGIEDADHAEARIEASSHLVRGRERGLGLVASVVADADGLDRTGIRVSARDDRDRARRAVQQPLPGAPRDDAACRPTTGRADDDQGDAGPLGERMERVRRRRVGDRLGARRDALDAGRHAVQQLLGVGSQVLAVGLVRTATWHVAVREDRHESERGAGRLGDAGGEGQRVLRAGRVVDSDDDLGHGSSFRWWSPIVRSAEAVANRARPSEIGGTSRAGRGKLRIADT